MFLAIFVVLLGIGDGAPSVLVELMSDAETDGIYATDGETTYTTRFNLERENQLFWVDLRVGAEALEETMDLDIDFVVRAKS